MVLCFRCGAALPEGAASCPACGQDLAVQAPRPAPGPGRRSQRALPSAAAAPHPPDALVAGRYRVRALLGAGPLGWVYRALDEQLQLEVALKVIDPALAASAGARLAFARQLRAARARVHPLLARVHEEGEDAGRLFCASQLVEGRSLRAAIAARRKQGTAFSPQEAEPLLAQVCAALEAAHAQGPHGGLKAENVLLLPDGTLKVTDCGLGLALPRQAYVQAERAAGAGRHLAPELVAGQEVDGRADVFALGVLLEDLVGPKATTGPPGLVALHARAVAPDREARLPTPAAFLAELTQVVQALGPGRAPAPVSPAPDAALLPTTTRPMEASTLADALLEAHGEGRPPTPPHPGTEALGPPPPLEAPDGEAPEGGLLRWPVAAGVAAAGLLVGLGLGLWLVERPRPLPLAPQAPAVVAAPDAGSPVVAAAVVDAGADAGLTTPAEAPARGSGGTVLRVPTCPEGMAGVPARPGARGGGRAFCIDTLEYPGRAGALPRARVTHAEARASCAQAHKRLCTEAEWQRACEGPAGSRWPYGDAFDPARCNTEDESGAPRQLAAGGAFGRCRSVLGVVDLSGNLAEWTQERVLKGGSFASAGEATRCSARKAGGGPRSPEVGFRCCAGPRVR